MVAQKLYLPNDTVFGVFGLFERSWRDAIAKKNANESRKFPLRFDNRRHEIIDSLFLLG